MHIQVQGKQVEVGAALTEHVTQALAACAQKYFDRPVKAIVTFSRDARDFRCDARIHLPTGLTAASRGRAADCYAAFDQGVERIGKQLRRHKRRLRDHHHDRRKPIEAAQAPAYVLGAADSAGAAAETDGQQPVIVADMTQSIEPLSVGEAVMRLEMAERPFLMFRNHANGRFNLVYRRNDGNVGWLDPAGLPAL
ncbi:MAG TPA: ribosome-associated translation inhibitor RaiA [Paracoccaceae bacterium]|nr:ribosome-associated translation inhibitor RaiA [Paracoccaceae bacterium]